jgi:hypothetical protein
MTVLWFNPDARILGVVWPLFAIAAALVIGLVLRSLVDRFLEEGDPRRYYVSQAVLYVGTFLIIAMSVWLKHR